MNPKPPITYARLRALFEQCVELPPAELADWLDRHVGDTGLRIELELMLAADANATPLLRHDPVSLVDRLDVDAAEPASLVGHRYGAFQLVELLGRGGQGAVYRAERVDADFHQVVALKLLNQGIHSAQEHQRFRRERRILARLDHPGVARLIDGGVSDEGVPYLVMEYVDGVPIDHWCRRHDCRVDQRLALFEQLCASVAAAHRGLIVHRDLKPANVLVSAAGEVKVLDFGIARLLDDDGDDRSRTQSTLLTPGYCAPEQIDGGPVTLATDVHALGVMLRELLTGVAPSRGESRAAPVGTAQLAPELGWIIAKACAREPERRYRDARELGDDITRFRCSQSVHAHPPSTLYQLRTFVRRHRGGVIVGIAVLLGVLASAAVALWQAQVAREHAVRAEATRDFLLGVFQSAQEDLAADERPTPAQLVAAAMARMDRDTRLPAATRADFLLTLGHVARYGNDPAAALPLYEQALALLPASVDPRTRLHVEVAQAWSLLALGRADDAKRIVEPLLEALRRSDDAIAVDGLWAYADALGELGQLADYLRLLGEVRALAQRVHPAGAMENLRLAGAYSLALSDVGRLRESAEVLESTLQAWRDAGAPQQSDYAIGLANLAMLKRRTGDLDAAERLLGESTGLNRRIHGADHPDVAAGMQVLGIVLVERGRFAEAEPILLHAQATLLKVHGASHPLSISANSALGLLDLERQRHADAEMRLQATRNDCRASGRDATDSRCITLQHRLGDTLLRLGRVDEAEAAARDSLVHRRAIAGADSPDAAIPLRACGDVQFARGEPAAALATYDEALALYAREGIDASLEVATIEASRARALLAVDRVDEALLAIQRADAITLRIVPANAGRRLRVLATHAQVVAAGGRSNDARAIARSAQTLEAARAVLDAGEWEALQSIAR